LERLAARMRGDHGEWTGEASAAAVEYLPPGANAKRDDTEVSSQRPPVVFVWRR